MFSRLLNLFGLWETIPEPQISTLSDTQIVKLKNGGEAPAALVKFVMQKLQEFQSFSVECDPMSAHFLVQKCQNPQLELMPFTKQRLQQYGFLDENGLLPQSVQDIVLSALDNNQNPNECAIKFIDPIEPQNHRLERF